MPLKERIRDEMKAALLGGDRFVGDTLRNLNAAILNEEVASGRRDGGLDDEIIEKIIAREVKKRHESARLYRENDRPELAEPEEREAQILSSYLPQQLTEAEVAKIVEETIAAMKVDGPSAMGQVIGAVKQTAGNRVDGAMLARIVKEKLAQK